MKKQGVGGLAGLVAGDALSQVIKDGKCSASPGGSILWVELASGKRRVAWGPPVSLSSSFRFGQRNSERHAETLLSAVLLYEAPPRRDAALRHRPHKAPSCRSTKPRRAPSTKPHRATAVRHAAICRRPPRNPAAPPPRSSAAVPPNGAPPPSTAPRSRPHAANMDADFWSMARRIWTPIPGPWRAASDRKLSSTWKKELPVSFGKTNMVILL
jgi:hypothetical protein